MPSHESNALRSYMGSAVAEAETRCVSTVLLCAEKLLTCP